MADPYQPQPVPFVQDLSGVVHVRMLAQAGDSGQSCAGVFPGWVGLALEGQPGGLRQAPTGQRAQPHPVGQCLQFVRIAALADEQPLR